MIILSSLSCLSVVSFAANVVDFGYTSETADLENDEEKVVAWELYDDGVLKLYDDAGSPAWAKYASQIKSVVATAKDDATPCAVTSIPGQAFYGCENLTTVDFNDAAATLREIGAHAFDGCTALASINLPNGIVSLGDYAFYGCASLESAKLSASLESVGKNVFKGCTALETVTVPNGMTVIGYGMFEDCAALTTANLPDSIVDIGAHAFEGCSALTDVIIPDSVTKIDEYAFYDSGIKTAHIGHSVQFVGDYIFGRCDALEEVTFTSAIKAIGDWMFYNCSSLNTIVDFPESVEEIGAHAFEGCVALTEVAIPNTVEVIGDSAFAGCSALSNVALNTALEGIGANAFNGTAIASITIPYNVKTIGAGAFGFCSALTDIVVDDANDIFKSVAGILYTADLATLIVCPAGKTGSVVIPDATKEIGANAFRGCAGVTDVTIPDSVEKIDVNAFNGCSDALVFKSSCSSYAADYALLYGIAHEITEHTGITEWVVTVEPTCDTDGVKEQQCADCGFVTATDSVDALGHDYELVDSKEPTCDVAGYNKFECKNCNDTYVDGIPATGVHNYQIIDSKEANCEEDGYKIYSCDECYDTYTDTFPATGHTYDAGVITKHPTIKEDGEITYTCQNADCDYSYVDVIPNTMFAGLIATNDGAYADENGIQNLTWFITDANELVVLADGTAKEWTPYRNSIVAATIAGDATTVENGSFAQMPELAEANILLSLGTIEAYAFQQCPKLKKVTTGSIATIENFAFYDCNELEYVDIYGGLEEGKVGDNIFNGCEKLSTVLLGNGSIELGYAMFKGCSALEEIVLPESILVIGDSAFDGTSLKTIRIPTDVEEIGKGAFTNCTALTEINVDNKNDYYFSVDGVLYDIRLNTLMLCPAGKSGEVAVWEGTTAIADDAFIGCKGITKVIIPNSVMQISSNAFNNCATDIVIKGNCDSQGILYAISRGIATEITHVASDMWVETTAPTCLAVGAKERVCSGCEYVYETIEIPALGHDYDDGVITTKATCEADGVVTFTCTRSGCSEFYTDVLPKTEHSWDDGVVIVDATCEAEGTKRFSCENDGCYDYYDIQLPALGHSYDAGTITTPATCEDDGEIVFACTNKDCSESYTEVISAIGHNYIATEIKKATCLEDGKIEHTCANCGDSYIENTKGEHVLYSTPVKVAPTCTDAGKEGYRCAVCNQFVGETKEIPATGHKYENGVCSGCGASDASQKPTTPGGTVITPEGSTGGSTDTGSTAKVPATPKLLLLTNRNEGLVLTWKEVEGAKGYRVYRRSAGAKSWTYLATVEDCTYVDKTATTGEYWRYTVRATNDAGFSGFENGIYIKRVATPHLTSIVNVANGVKVTWNAVSNAKTYKVYRRGAGETWKCIATVKGTSYVDTAIKANSGNYYRYTVRAIDGYYSAYESGLVTKYVAAPHLTGIANTANGVKVNWNTVNGADSYRVYRRAAGQSWVYVTTVTGTSYVDTAVSGSGYYRYTVRAVDGSLSAYESGLVIKK